MTFFKSSLQFKASGIDMYRFKQLEINFESIAYHKTGTLEMLCVSLNQCEDTNGLKIKQSACRLEQRCKLSVSIHSKILDE